MHKLKMSIYMKRVSSSWEELNRKSTQKQKYHRNSGVYPLAAVSIVISLRLIFSIDCSRSASCDSIVWILLLFRTIGFATMRGLLSKFLSFFALLPTAIKQNNKDKLDVVLIFSEHVFLLTKCGHERSAHVGIVVRCFKNVSVYGLVTQNDVTWKSLKKICFVPNPRYNKMDFIFMRSSRFLGIFWMIWFNYDFLGKLLP